MKYRNILKRRQSKETPSDSSKTSHNNHSLSSLNIVTHGVTHNVAHGDMNNPGIFLNIILLIKLGLAKIKK